MKSIDCLLYCIAISILILTACFVAVTINSIVIDQERHSWDRVERAEIF